MKKLILLLTFCFGIIAFTKAQSGHNIRVKIKNFEQDTLFLGNHYGEKQYMVDTVAVNDNGEFVFSGEEELPGGIYLVILPPNNRYFEIVIDEKDQNFSITTEGEEFTKNMKFKGSSNNDLFRDYSLFLSGKGKEAAELREKHKTATEEAEKKKIDGQFKELNKVVRAYQTDIVKKHPENITTAIIKATWDVEVPETFTGTEEEVKLQRFQYYRSHYFDNIDLGDSRLLRSPMLFKKVISYLDNLTYQMPDSLIVSIDYLLKKMEPSKESYRFYLGHFLNKYANSKFVGMDAIYVHLAENYYCAGKDWWLEEEQRQKICDNAYKISPILIGRTAPDIEMQLQNGQKLNLHSVDSEYTVVFFWDPDCGHCKESIPKVIEFYDKYSKKGVEIFAVCTRLSKDLPMCWEAIEEKKMVNWVNVVDPFLRSKYKTLYDIRSTPRIFVLDKNKKIISKGIAGEQLEEVMEKLMIQYGKDSDTEGTGKR